MEVTLLVEATENAFRILGDARKHAEGIIDSALELTSEETRHHEAKRIQEIFTGAQKRKTAFQNFIGTAVILYAFWILFGWLLNTGGLSLSAGEFAVVGFVQLFISGAFGWLLGSGAVWALSNFVFERRISFGAVIPITGYAHAPLFIVPIVARLNLGAGIGFVFAGIWAAAMMVTGFQSNLDMPQERAIGAALVGMFVWVLFVLVI